MAWKNLNTYAGWTIDGRQIIQGEHAKQYAIWPDETRQALFHISQTVELEPQRDLSEAQIVTVEAHKAARKAATTPRIKLSLAWLKNGNVQQSAWVGSSKELLPMMKENGFKFHGNKHRWMRIQGAFDTKKFIDSLQAKGILVELVVSDELQEHMDLLTNGIEL